jgi:DNA polymerase III delta prime subunit
MNNSRENIPWVEKYRPSKFNDIVLDPSNKVIFENILKTGYFPNLLFYGPPGTGKTTTIMNLISEYNNTYNNGCKGSVIHLNASDERGIDIIRNQIYQFVKSNNFFCKGLKFVVLDEVDYMTKNAQHALKYLLQTSSYNVRYCLICNYISKIDESLKNEFICIRFNQLPQKEIHSFIENIIKSEELIIDVDTIEMIQYMYNSDIRSMINFIQLHQKHKGIQTNIITNKIWEQMKTILDKKEKTDIHSFIQSTCIQYNIDKKTAIKQYYNYIIRNYPSDITITYLNNIEVLLHNDSSNIDNMINYMKEIHTNYLKN